MLLCGNQSPFLFLYTTSGVRIIILLSSNRDYIIGYPVNLK
ncbi:hypothetical protein M114_2292 [Bacteroides fragilis str. 3986 N(B)22]|nr:hypothetical protein M114_2292 [Bacteroides fragilis str. 3986 N(B)22]